MAYEVNLLSIWHYFLQTFSVTPVCRRVQRITLTTTLFDHFAKNFHLDMVSV